MFNNQPKGLYVLALSNTGERFGYYTMLAILLLFLQAKFAFSTATAGFIYSTFLALVYFMPMLGGIVADKWNFQKTVALGIVVMFLGYLLMAVPTARMATSSMYIMFGALLLIAIGTGLFKGNLQVMVGDLYNEPRYADKRDVAFSLFYMAINIGAMFAPSVTSGLLSYALKAKGFVYDPALPSICTKIVSGETPDADAMATLNNYIGAHAADFAGQTTEFANAFIDAISTGYSYAFAVACASMVVSFLIYKFGYRTYRHVGGAPAAAGTKGTTAGVELTKAQTKSRIVALLLVFTVVIFFWMVFHQNGMTLTKFAEVFTSTTTGSWTRIFFNVWALATVAVLVYAVFALFQSKKLTGKLVGGLVTVAAAVGIYFFYRYTPETVSGLQPQIYQQFNPFYVVALTPFSVAFFAMLAKRRKEPSAPRKIGLGMLVAAFAFGFLCISSLGLGVAPTEGQGAVLVSPNVLIATYLFLTFAELLLSPMGISFVSKVAPPKYKGLMMGCWFGATAIGNYLVVIPALLWNEINVAVLWGILIAVCLLSALFIFSIMKKLESATADAPAPRNDEALETVEDDVI